MTAEMEPKILAEGPCGAKLLRLTEKRWQGLKVLDLRLFWWHESAGEWRPAKQGVQLSVENWRAVIDCLQEACKED